MTLLVNTGEDENQQRSTLRENCSSKKQTLYRGASLAILSSPGVITGQGNPT